MTQDREITTKSSGEDERAFLARLLSAADAGTLDLMAFTEMPKDPIKIGLLGDCVDREISRMTQGRLSQEDLSFLNSFPCDAEEVPQDAQAKEGHIFDVIDEVLIEQASILGWRLLASSTVVGRIAIWSDHDYENGAAKGKRFREALDRYDEVKRGKNRLPFTEPEWYQTRINALQEVKGLQKGLRAQFAKGYKFTGLAEMYEVIRAEIAKMPDAYPNLNANLTSFLNYLQKEDSPSTTISALTPRFLTGSATPASVLDGWLDYQCGTADGKSRQVISRLASRKRL